MSIYGLYSKGPFVEKIQRALNEKMGLNLTCDGDFGKISISALTEYQKSIGVREVGVNGVFYGPATDAILGPYIEQRFLTESDYVKAAVALNIPVMLIKAVTTVEAKKYGFLKNGHPILLFERHKFYQALVRYKGNAFAQGVCAKYPDICNPDDGGYLGGMDEIKRLSRARAIHDLAGLESASYGLFQIMGFNHKAAGYPDVVSYFNAMCVSEDNQMQAFASFVKANPGIWKALKDKNYTEFARQYNGANYALGGYHTKIKDEFERLVKQNGMVVV